MTTLTQTKFQYIPTWNDEVIEQYEDFMAQAMQAEEELEVLRSIAEETHTAWEDFDEEADIEALNASLIASFEQGLPRHMRDSDYL